MPQKAIFLKIQLWLLWPEMADDRPIAIRKTRSIPKSPQNFLYRPKPKIDDFIQKIIPPLPHFYVKMGWGGGRFPFCRSDLTWIDISFFFSC